MILLPIIKYAAKVGFKKLFDETPVQRAAAATAAEFPACEVTPSLKTWCESDDFAQLLEAFNGGDRSVTPESIVSSFVRTTGFFNAEETESSARSVLESFQRNLEKEIYDSDEGISTLANRQEQLHIETREETRSLVTRQNKDFVDQVSALKQDIAGIVAAADTGKSAEIQDKVFGARIDEARQLLREGRFRSARSRLEIIRKEAAASDCSVGSQFHIARGLALCAIQLDELETAKTELTVALTLKQSDPEALAYAAFVAARLDENERASNLLADVLSSDLTVHPHTASIVMRVMCLLGRIDEAQQYIDARADLKSNSDCLLTLGQCLYDQQKFSESEALFRQAIEGGTESPFAHFFLALSIFYPTRDSLNLTPNLRWRIPKQLINRLEEAKRELTKALELFGKFEDPSHRHDALVNRATINGMLNNVEDGLRDCDAVLVEDESNVAALRNKGMFLSKAGRHSDAIKAFERIKDQTERAGFAVILASDYLFANRPKEAVTILEPLLTRNSADAKQIAVAELLISSYDKLGRADAIKKLLADLKTADPTNADVIGLHAEAEMRARNFDAAIALFQEALAYSTGAQRDILVLQLAETFFQVKNWSEAAALYAQIVDTTYPSRTLTNYIVSLFNSGSLNDALKLATQLRAGGQPILIVSEVEAASLEYMGDLEHAKELYLSLGSLDPQNVWYPIKAARIELRLDHTEEARALIDDIPYTDFKDNPVALMKIAELRALLKMGEVLPLAYRARQLGYNSGDTHHDYIRLFVNREVADNALLSTTDEVQKDTTVHLTRGNEKFRFTIVDDDSPIDRHRDEISLKDDLAKKLLGHRKGETVTIKDSPLEQLSYQITDVQSKYVSAFQESISNFSTWFPDNAALNKVEVNNQDISPFLTQLDRHHAIVSNALTVYKQTSMPLSLLADSIGRSYLEIWTGMVSDPKGKIFSSAGVKEDTAAEADLLTKSTDIVLDLSSLLTLSLLKLTSLLPKRFDNIFVTQSTLDLITEELFNLEAATAPKAIVGRTDTGYFHYEINQEQRESWIKFLKAIKEFLTNTAKITPVEKSVQVSREWLEQMEGILGPSGATCVLAAQERKLPLYSDDLGLRTLARTECEVASFSTQTVLADLQSKKLITADKYTIAIRQLILSNYAHIGVSANDLMWVLRDDQSQRGNSLPRIMHALHGPDCDEDSAVVVGADFTRLVWVESILYHEKLSLLDLTLVTITKGRSVPRVLAKFKNILRHRFALLPLQLEVILENITLWERHSRLKKGFVQ